jgi:predicted porin
MLGKELWRPLEGAYDTSIGLPPGNDTKWRVGLGLLDWRGLSLTGIYESRSDILGMPERAAAKMWQIQGSYAFGNSVLKTMYGQSRLSECADPLDIGYRYTCSVGVLGQVFGSELLGPIDQKSKSTWAVGLDQHFSKRTRAYALYTAVSDDNEDADWSGFSLGLAHYF